MESDLIFFHSKNVLPDSNKVEYVIIMLVESSRNDVEGMEPGLFDLVVPLCHRESCSILDGVPCKDHPQ